MTITKKAEGSVVTLAVEGRLDTITAPELEAVVKESIPEAEKLVINFAELAYCSSAGLRVLLAAHKGMLSKGGKLVICSVNETVDKVFSVTGLSGILNIEK